MSFLGLDIGSILRSEGPTVKCVLLSSFQKPCAEIDQDNLKMSGSNYPDQLLKHKENGMSEDSQKIQASSSLNHLINEMSVDTTPSNAMVQQILGGPITFLGQYEEEGIVVIARRPEKDEDDNQRLALNPHLLQPPLHKLQVYGDILIMKVAPIVEEEEDSKDEEEDDVKEDVSEEEKVGESLEKISETDFQLKRPFEEIEEDIDEDEPEFFLNYTKEEYIRFASRTDIVYESSDEEEGNAFDDSDDDDELYVQHGLDHDEGDDETDEEYEMGQDDGESDSDDDEGDIGEKEGQIGLMNLIFSQLLRKFREENGRGPDSEELLAMRSLLADKLGIDIEGMDVSLHASEAIDKGEYGDEEKLSGDTMTRKRPISEEDESFNEEKVTVKKRVNFRDE